MTEFTPPRTLRNPFWHHSSDFLILVDQSLNNNINIVRLTHSMPQNQRHRPVRSPNRAEHGEKQTWGEEKLQVGSRHVQTDRQLDSDFTRITWDWDGRININTRGRTTWSGWSQLITCRGSPAEQRQRTNKVFEIFLELHFSLTLYTSRLTFLHMVLYYSEWDTRQCWKKAVWKVKRY